MAPPKKSVSVHNGSTPIVAQLNLRNLCRLANLPVEIYLRFIVRAPVYQQTLLLRISFTKDSAFLRPHKVSKNAEPPWYINL